MHRRSRSVATVVALLCVSLAHAQESETRQAKIRRALSAGPPSISEGARVVDMAETGKMVELRGGKNGFTCFAGHPGVVGDDPGCADPAGLQWILDWAAHKQKPTNTQPGIIFMLAGGTDWSATDPWATSGTPQKWPPGWLIAWPFNPKATGLTDKPNSTGPWIMWAGTPYAHLMLHEKP